MIGIKIHHHPKGGDNKSRTVYSVRPLFFYTNMSSTSIWNDLIKLLWNFFILNLLHVSAGLEHSNPILRFPIL